MLVSKKASAPGIVFVPVEFESGRQAVAILAQSRDRLFAAGIAGDLEAARSGNRNLNLVAFFEFQHVDDGPWEADGQAATPFRNLHLVVPLIYNSYVYQIYQI